MTGRAFVLLLIAASTLYAARNVGVGWLYALGYALAVAVAASAVLGAWSLGAVRMSVAPGRRTEAGVPLPVSVTLSNPGARARRYLCILAAPLGAKGRLRPWRRTLLPDDWGSTLIPELKAGERLTIQLSIPAPWRGIYAMPEIYVQAAPLGLVAWTKRRHTSPLIRDGSRISLPMMRGGSRISLPMMGGGSRISPPLDGGGLGGGVAIEFHEDIVVHPKIHVLGRIPGIDGRRGDGEALTSARPRNGGELIKAVRPYRSGDSLRQIHWKTTARTGRLAVRENEGEDPELELEVLLDDFRASSMADFEVAIEVAASLLAHAKERGVRARLVVQAGEPAAQTLDGQLDWLAGLTNKEPGISNTSPGFPRRSGVAYPGPQAQRGTNRGPSRVVISPRKEGWEGQAAVLHVPPNAAIADVLRELR